ncbi:hypothetical protein [Edwardsiella tarda]|uniref:hypothetical protein n=1 Tax=Edwardsiella tarda TaxID=636 RepID=UPI0002AD0640|nr:hypothetical protein [Edwardsiella tarda]UCQ52873.1 hypothetical protein DCF75_08735 [Edwardsiella tarda]GAC63419.1 hypothetical protein ET1_05_01050 [Edwardsiella tarda ATCC 15947 = NBRC 105688]STD45913.1 Uncharacterised protein [Edwardsiella tarda]
MKELVITINGLAKHERDTTAEEVVGFTVYCGDNVLVSDSILGKSSSSYSRSYTVGDVDGEFKVVHNRPDLRELEVRAALS